MAKRKYEKVLGQRVLIGSKKWNVLKWQVKHFEDLRKGSN